MTLRSSLGFHTMTLYNIIFSGDTAQLIRDFQQYSQMTGSIKMYKDKHGNGVIKFFPEYRGIQWLIYENVYLGEFRTCVTIINVEINPKILGGVHDYITAATYDDMETAITNFNRISKKISPLLGTFDNYSIKRVDYCINFALDELAPECTAEQMMTLIKRSNIPPYYKEWMCYDDTAHRMKSRPSSFYLMNNSVHINCYSKYMKLKEQNQENMENGYPPIAQATMEAARDIIRFEVQCKYRKIYALSHWNKKSKSDNASNYKVLLSHDACMDRINEYYNKTIGRGHWYTLQLATSLIRSHHFNRQKEHRLIDALQFVNQCRSITKAKEAYQGNDLESFNRTLKDLSSLGINPATIPKEWGIGRIWSLLDTYYSKLSMERINKQYAAVMDYTS